MKEGRGDIQLDFDADVPHGRRNRRLVFENHHQSRIAAYLVNCLVPRDPDIRITAQSRNYQQSSYRLDYVQTGVRSGPLSRTWWSDAWGWLGTAALLLLAQLALLWRQRASAAIVRNGVLTDKTMLQEGRGYEARDTGPRKLWDAAEVLLLAMILSALPAPIPDAPRGTRTERQGSRKIQPIRARSVPQ